MLNRFRFLIPLLLVAPTLVAAGLGRWNELAALQQHIGLALLHPISDLLLRSPFADDGLIGWVEIPLVLAAVVVTLSTARRWEPRLHPLALWVVDLLEGVLALVALVAVLGLAAVACSLDRPLFFAGLLLVLFLLRSRRDRSDRLVEPESLQPELLPATGELGRWLALALAGLAGLMMLLSLLQPWLAASDGPSLDGSRLSYGWFGAVLGGAVLIALSRWPERRAGIALGLGTVAAAHFAVSRWFWLPDTAAAGLGLVLFGWGAALLLSAGLLEQHRPLNAGWRGPANSRRRALAGALGLAVLVFAATSIWEGISYRNPLFRVSRLWLDRLGGSPWTSGLAWWVLAMGLIAGAWKQRSASVLRRGAAASGWQVGGLAALLSCCGSLGHPQFAIAGSLSALALLAVAWFWTPLCRAPISLAPAGLLSLDPRRWLVVVMPLALWSTLCLARGLSVFMWTAPVDLPEGVERLAGPQELGDPGCIFSLAVDRERGDLWFTDRCRTSVARLSADLVLSDWPLRERGASQVEELGGPIAGRLWLAVSAWTDEAQLVLLAADQQGPAHVGEVGASVPVASCWVSAWIPVPAERPGEPASDVLIGCEEHSMSFVFSARDGILGPAVQLGAQVEDAAFHPGGSHLYTVSLWRDSVVKRWSWPYLEAEGERFIGPFNWGVLASAEPPTLWVSRFLEGSLLAFDPENGALREQIPLSFGVRALHYDPVHQLIWAAASYSGRLWAIEAGPPYGRRSFALCGQTRDIDSDAQGRVLLASDCGIYRIDPAAWRDDG
ncbi:MAG: hypothetical protein CMP23_00895 [Rickettsiales bacterium]|nr:hypothetical protein [Rickettsiales bacterium]